MCYGWHIYFENTSAPTCLFCIHTLMIGYSCLVPYISFTKKDKIQMYMPFATSAPRANDDCVYTVAQETSTGTCRCVRAALLSLHIGSK